VATKDQLIASAQKNLEKGQINKAIKDYQELLKLEPKVDQHKQKLADLLCRANLKEDALVLYDSLAKGYTERGFFAKGVAVYKQMQRIDPAATNVYLRLAELNCNLGLIGNAMSEYRSLLDYFEKRNMAANAAEILQKMAELEPENINLQLRVLQNFLKDKLYVQATATILKACEVCAKSGDSAKSQKILHSILSHLPDNHEFHIEIANKLSAGGLFPAAIYVFDSLLQSSPQDPLLLTELAKLYGKINDPEKELLVLNQLLAVQPTVAVAEKLVRLSLAMKDYSRSHLALEEQEALFDKENPALLIDLYQELEKQRSGDKGGGNATDRFSGEELPTITADGVSSPFAGDASPVEDVEEFSMGNEEFEIDDLLTLHPRSSDPAPLSQEESSFAEEAVETDFSAVSMELPEEGMSFDDIDTFVQAEEQILTEEISQDDVASSLIHIDFDFSEFDDVEVETTVESEDEAVVEIEDETVVEMEEITLPPAETDADLEEIIEAEEEFDNAVIEDLEIEILEEALPEPEDDDEILELEPLEEEELDLDAELAALEDLLAAGMAEPALEQSADVPVAVEPVVDAVLPVEDDFFDLAAEILDDWDRPETKGLESADENASFRFDSVFSDLEKGANVQIDHEDSEAHYDLGIAYKEMGLMDDAIAEFKKSMRSPKRLADSLNLIGICYAEKGSFADAEAVFSTAIARPDVQTADKISTQYELGLVYEVWGRPADALRTFAEVADSDPSFRNVGDKIAALRLLMAVESDKTVGDTPESVSPGKDRISFV
jgi:tetratricopeptide (TPR) repeat protein